MELDAWELSKIHQVKSKKFPPICLELFLPIVFVESNLPLLELYNVQRGIYNLHNEHSFTS